MLLFISIFLLTSCTNSVTISQNDPPIDDGEFLGEATIVRLEDRMTLEEAKTAISRAYPEFSTEEDDSFFAPSPRRVKFINCTETDDGKEYTMLGKTSVSYEFGGAIKRRTFRDSCDFKTLTEHYCRDNRFGIIMYECPAGCWEGEACK